MARRETENNAYAKFWGDKQKTLWYVMVFSGVVNSQPASQARTTKFCFCLGLGHLQLLSSSFMKPHVLQL